MRNSDILLVVPQEISIYGHNASKFDLQFILLSALKDSREAIRKPCGLFDPQWEFLTFSWYHEKICWSVQKSNHIFSNSDLFKCIKMIYSYETPWTACIMYIAQKCQASVTYFVNILGPQARSFGCFKWRIFFQMLFIDMLNLLNDDHPKKIWAAKRVSWARKKNIDCYETSGAICTTRLGLLFRGGQVIPDFEMGFY